MRDLKTVRNTVLSIVVRIHKIYLWDIRKSLENEIYSGFQIISQHYFIISNDIYKESPKRL